MQSTNMNQENSSVDALFASRSFAPLTQEERAVKRTVFANFFSKPVQSCQLTDLCRGLAMYTGVDRRGTGAIFLTDNNGTQIVPEFPTLQIKSVDEESSLEELTTLLNLCLAGQALAPVPLRESFVVAAWYNSLYGGWNVTSKNAINAWSYFGRSGEAVVTEGAMFDRAVANMRLDGMGEPLFADSNEFIDSGLLDPAHIYFFEVLADEEYKVAAQPSGKGIPPILLHAVYANEHSKPVPADDLVELRRRCFQECPVIASNVSILYEGIKQIAPPFECATGLYFMDANGNRTGFVNTTYHSLRKAVIDEQIPLTTLFMRRPELRSAILAVYPEKAASIEAATRNLARLAAWVSVYNTHRRETLGVKAHRQLVDFSAKFPANVSEQEVMSRLAEGRVPLTGINRILKCFGKVAA
jgi:hypothetical protein